MAEVQWAREQGQQKGADADKFGTPWRTFRSQECGTVLHIHNLPPLALDGFERLNVP